MSTVPTTTTETPVIYPERDGKPMGETDVHIDALIYLRETLKDFFRDVPNIYVAGNMLLYYEEGNPAACVAPDVFVVHGVAKRERRTYKMWEEGRPPTVVFEISSRGTRLEDLGTKRALYALLGVQEYFLYDPLGEYLRPPLQGYSLEEGEYRRVVAVDEGRLVSTVLGVELRLEDGRVRVKHLATSEPLLTPAEAFEARRKEAAARRRAEEQVRQEATARQVVEEKMRQEVAARQVVEEKMRQEVAARQTAEEQVRQEATARQVAEEKMKQEASARQVVEEKMRQEASARQTAEAEIARLRAEVERLRSGSS